MADYADRGDYYDKERTTQMKKAIRHMVFVMTFLLCITYGSSMVQAEDKTITVTDEGSAEVELVVGDTGKILPSITPSSSAGSGSDSGNGVYYYDWYEDDYEEDYVDVAEETPVRFSYTLRDHYWGSEDHCITIDESGNFKAVKAGTDTVEVYGYGASGAEVFEAEVYFTVHIDMSQVSLKKTELTGYLFESARYGDEIWYQPAKLEIPISSPVVLDEDTMGLDVRSESSNSEVWVYASVTDNKLSLELSASKKCSTNLTITMGGKDFKVHVTLQPVKIFSNSYLLEKGHTKKFTISGYSGKISWSSTNPKVASVTKSGVVRGRAIGNAVITAKIGEQRVGCGVSVTTAAIKKVCARGTYIYKNWKYSQPKRAQNGYYDCSALVWKSYKQYTKINFGSASYPGTTKTESAWCRDHKKLLKGGFSYSKIQKMQLNPGDIVFKSDNPKEPYNSTSHVEMFIGYACTGYDSNGKPLVIDKWASREDGYGYSFAEGAICARPTK